MDLFRDAGWTFQAQIRIPIVLLLKLPSISCCCVGRESSICNPGFGYCTAGVNLPFFHHACMLPFPFLFSIHFRTHSSGGKNKTVGPSSLPYASKVQWRACFQVSYMLLVHQPLICSSCHPWQNHLSTRRLKKVIFKAIMTTKVNSQPVSLVFWFPLNLWQPFPAQCTFCKYLSLRYRRNIDTQHEKSQLWDRRQWEIKK